jgi:hypothetical protein
LPHDWLTAGSQAEPHNFLSPVPKYYCKTNSAKKRPTPRNQNSEILTTNLTKKTLKYYDEKEQLKRKGGKQKKINPSRIKQSRTFKTKSILKKMNMIFLQTSTKIKFMTKF